MPVFEKCACDFVGGELRGMECLYHARVRRELESKLQEALHGAEGKRWNMHRSGDGEIQVCFGDHERGKVPAPEQIRRTRLLAGATLEEMSALLHVSKRTYQDWESGRTNMHANHWLAMRCACVALGSRRDQIAREIRGDWAV